MRALPLCKDGMVFYLKLDEKKETYTLRELDELVKDKKNWYVLKGFYEEKKDEEREDI